MILRNREAELGMHATFARQYVHQCPAEGCPYRAARYAAWLICAGGHWMEARQS